MSRLWGEKTYREIASRAQGRLVAILPLGAIEAHGPHLPLSTDSVIAQAMAEEGARRLADHKLEALVLPTLHYSAAPFAREFHGTVSVRPDTVDPDPGHRLVAVSADRLPGPGQRAS